MIKHKIGFEQAIQKATIDTNTRSSIGEEQEKMVHATLKHYFEDDKTKQEVKIEGFITDIYNEEGIIEIQTRSFDKLRHKLDAYLPKYDVTIVYPIIENTYVAHIDKDLSLRKSPIHKSIVSAFKEIYKIKFYLKNPCLHFHFVYLDIKDLKCENGLNRYKKIRYKSIDKIPIKLNNEQGYDNYHDFIHILDGIDDNFTVKSLSKLLKSKRQDTSYLVLVLKYLELIEVVDKIKREYIYKVKRG